MTYKEYYENTDPRFFEHWDRDELNFEAARLNRLLEDMKKIISKSSESEENNPNV